MQYSFPKENRLSTEHDFSLVFKHPDGRFVEFPWIALYLKNNLSHSRLGIVISKSFVKRAVDRNNLRRVVRESFRCACVNGFDVVVLADKRIMHSLDQAKSGAEKLWQRFKSL